MLAQPPPPQLTGNPGEAWSRAMRRDDFEAAWAVSDAVLAARDPATRDDPSRPYHERFVWDGTPLSGRRVLVRCYHGLGDTLQFSRYLPHLARIAAEVTVEAPPPVLPLLPQGAFRRHGFDPANPLPPSEVDVEIMELAHALRLRPDPAPYLRASPLPGPPGRVGFCWNASGWNPGRNMPAALLIRAAAGRRAISLQRGEAAADATILGAVDPLDGSMDLVSLAGLIAGLNAVVTIDTMVAHLGGALGVPTYILLPHDSDWRWGAGDRSAWYSSARLVRQPYPGDWAGAVRALAGTFPGRDGS